MKNVILIGAVSKGYVMLINLQNVNIFHYTSCNPQWKLYPAFSGIGRDLKLQIESIILITTTFDTPPIIKYQIMKQKVIKILFFSNLTVAGLILGLTLVFPIYSGLILTGVGAILAAIICGIEIIKENTKKENS